MGRSYLLRNRDRPWWQAAPAFGKGAMQERGNAALFYSFETSTMASKEACPEENENRSTASSGIDCLPDVSRLSPCQPSRIHTVPDRIFAVTRARAWSSPRSLYRRMAAPSSMPRAAASDGEIHRYASGSA